MSLANLARRLRLGEASPGELLASQRDSIARRNKELRAFISVFGGRPPGQPRNMAVYGVTLAVKDNIYVMGHRTTAGSRILRRFVPERDAEVVARLKRAGAVVIGKSNLHEFAYGVTNINPHFGDCHNPWRPDRISGGSSGGSAVAVATGMACAGLGTDTAGSIRIPAALCGVVGYKPTYGAISRRGVVPLAWGLDTVGLIARSVADAAFLASLATDAGGPVPRQPKGRRGLRVGVPTNVLGHMDKEVRRSFDGALAASETGGVQLRRFSLRHLDETSACRTLIGMAEAASYHRRYFLGRSAEYGRDVRRRIAQGLAIPAAAYLDALRARGSLIGYYRSLFRSFDVIALPTTRIAAPTIRASKDEETAAGIRTDLLSLTEIFNVYGAPAISIPCGVTGEGLTVGLQLAADLGADDLLLSAAMKLEGVLSARNNPLHFGN